MRRRRGRDFDAAVEQPAMAAAIAIISEDRAVTVPFDDCFVFAQGAIIADKNPPVLIVK
jgi:hypothetical protein